jgi:hypothetical protein
MPVLVVIGLIGLVALGLIYWALVYIARGGGIGGKVFAVVAGAAITGLAVWASMLFLFLLAAANCPLGAYECPV